MRESLSTMKPIIWQQKAQAELPEEIVSEEEENKKPAEIQQPKPKIVCQSLYANTVATRSQAALQPYVI